MRQDISNKTVAILLIIAIVLSASLTFTALKSDIDPFGNKEISSANKGVPAQNTKVSLTVEPKPVEEVKENPGVN